MRGEGRPHGGRAVGIAAGLLVAAAAGGILWTLAPLTGGGSERPGGSRVVPDVARIVCDGAGTHVLTPEVRPEPDGVHFQVDNRLGEPVSFLVRSGLGDASGLGAGRGVAEIRGSGSRGGWPVPPGVASVRCLPQGEDAGAEGGWAELRVIDQDGVYVSAEADCAGSTVAYLDHAPGVEGGVGDPVEVTRRMVPGLQEGDVVEVAGYPEYGTEALVRVMRAGRTVAVVHVLRTTVGGWLPDRLVRCPEAGAAAALPTAARS